MTMAAAAGMLLTTGVAVAQDGRHATTPAAPTEAEMAACGRGALVACRKGYQYWMAQSDMGARSGDPRMAAQLEADYMACQSGTRSACTAFAAAYWPHMHQLGRSTSRSGQ